MTGQINVGHQLPPIPFCSLLSVRRPPSSRWSITRPITAHRLPYKIIHIAWLRLKRPPYIGLQYKTGPWAPAENFSKAEPNDIFIFL